jgi:S-adenosylmethionine hydrolase
MKIITFLSDFGNNDWFVAAVKGEILKINNSIIIVDISHTVHPHDIHCAAFILKCVYKNFPLGTVHLAVVDPGVGSQRKLLIVESDGYYFVGPDNGIFSYIYNEKSNVYVIEITDGMSSTFHARDVFGPVAAKLTRDEKAGDLGTRVQDFIKFELPRPQKKADTICGEIVYIDYFGNCITNIENSVHITDLHVIKNQIDTRFARAIFPSGQPSTYFTECLSTLHMLFLLMSKVIKSAYTLLKIGAGLGRIGLKCLSESSSLFHRIRCCWNYDLLKFQGEKIAVKNFYGEGIPGEVICVRGSSGYYEIACNRGNACNILHVKIGTKVVALMDTR